MSLSVIEPSAVQVVFSLATFDVANVLAMSYLIHPRVAV